MNSGFKQDRMLLDKQRKEEEIEKHDNLVAPVIAHGNAAEAFKSSPFWKVLERDLVMLRDSLLGDLKNYKLVQSKEAMRLLQVRISDLEMFIDMPNKYIEKLKDIQKRRGRKVV